MIAPRLAYVALVVTDVATAATTLEHNFGLRRTECPVAGVEGTTPVFAVGASALALFAPGDSFLGGPVRPGVHHIALEAEDLEMASDRAAAIGVPPAEPEPRSGLQGRRRQLLAPAATGGVQTWLCEPLVLDRSPADQVERIDHVGVATADSEAIVDAFVRRLGCPLESTQTDTEVELAVESFTSDKYGVVYHARPPRPVGGLRVAFVTVGDCELEVLQDLHPGQGAQVAHGRPGTTRQDQGAIARFVASRGPGLHHLALKVPDINAALGRLARAGHSLIDTVGRPGSRRALIGFLHPRSLNGVLVHLVQRPAA